MSRPDRGATRPVPAALRWWPPVVYPAAFLVASLTVQSRSAPRRDHDLLWASTNLDNLADHPVRALFVSAFLGEGDLLAWTVLAVLGLAGLVVAAGPARAMAVAVAAHLLGTAASEGLLAVRIACGVVPASQRSILDVGPSFVVVGVLVATVVAGRGPWWRLAAAAGFVVLAPSLFEGLQQGDVAAVGHLTASCVGLASGGLLLLRRRAPAQGAQPAARRSRRLTLPSRRS